MRRLIADQFPPWAHKTVTRVNSSGTDNAMYRLGDDLAVRMPRVEWAAKYVDREHAWMAVLEPHLTVPIPTPLAQGTPAYGYPWNWNVCPWLPGQTPTSNHLHDPTNHAEAAQLATDLARFVDALHDIDHAAQPDAPRAWRGAPLRTRNAPTLEAIAALQTINQQRPDLGTIDTDTVTTVWRAALASPEYDGPPVWLHADLAPGNLLCNYGQLSAVIDFGLMGTGDPAVDYIVAWNLLPPHAREVFKRESKVDDNTWARARGWALSMSLIVIPYYLDTNPTLVAISRHVITQILAETT